MEIDPDTPIRVVMPTVHEKTLKLIDALLELRQADTSHDNLGMPSGFHDFEAVKSDFCDYLVRLLKKTGEVADAVNPVVVENTLTQMDTFVTAIHATMQQIENLVGKGIHNTAFPNERESIIKSFRQKRDKWQAGLFDFETGVRVAKTEAVLASLDLDTIKDEAVEALGRVRETSSEAARLMDGLRDKALSASVTAAQTTFSVRASSHRQFEVVWLGVFIVASCFTIWAILNAALAVTDPVRSDRELIQFAVQRVLLISTAAAFMRLALVKHNIERNLRIIYDHRDTVLGQYRVFESAIGDTEDSRAAKNQFRIEIAKYIFSDPVTGYISAGSGSNEITINPAVSTIEKLVSK